MVEEAEAESIRRRCRDKGNHVGDAAGHQNGGDGQAAGNGQNGGDNQAGGNGQNAGDSQNGAAANSGGAENTSGNAAGNGGQENAQTPGGNKARLRRTVLTARVQPETRQAGRPGTARRAEAIREASRRRMAARPGGGRRYPESARSSGWRDTVWICISEYHDVNKLKEICELNGLEDENKIVSGQQLLLP